MRKYYITEAAKEIGVSLITLKRWILLGKVEDVSRDQNNWRVFTDVDIHRISAYAKHITDKSEMSADSYQSKKYRAASFFSGIGGFEYGFEKAGFEVTFQCENEPFCNSILEKHWPNVPRWSDITTLDHAIIPISDVWVGGFPCQDLSLARMGQRQGLRGNKSGLFYEFARLVGECKPRVFVIENVAGLLSSHKGRDFAILLHTMAELGYALGWRTLNSQYFGVPQSRQRVYIVGCRGDWRGPGSILFEPERGERNSQAGRSNGTKSSSPFKKIIGNLSGEGPVIQSIAYCLYATSARHTGTDWSRNYVCYPALGKVRRLTPAECEGVMAFPKDWTIPLQSNLDADSMDSARYHALGNAVTPPVAEWLARRIEEYLLNADAEEKEQESINFQTLG